jgi:hypothetical protein
MSEVAGKHRQLLSAVMRGPAFLNPPFCSIHWEWRRRGIATVFLGDVVLCEDAVFETLVTLNT